MPDPLSLSSAIVGFVEFAVEVAKGTAEFVQDFKDCRREFETLWLATYEFGVHVRRLTPTIKKVEERYGTEGILVAFVNFLLILARPNSDIGAMQTSIGRN
jgi:hypothetical protein